METDKRPLIMVATLVILLLIVFGGGIVLVKNIGQIKQLNQQNSALHATLEDRDSLMNEMVSKFDEIEQNLTFVRNKRNQMISFPLETGKSKNEILVSDIKQMNSILEESSKKLEELDKKLKTSGFKIKSFIDKIALLNKNLAEQDITIRQLMADVEMRDTTIAEMENQMVKLKRDIISGEDSLHYQSQVIAEKMQTIVEKENEMNEVFFVAGTYNQLAEKGILSKEGGFLGIAKFRAIRDDITEKSFTKLDMRYASQFRLQVKKAKLISQHPENSYRFVEQNDKIAYLEIENPEDFWRLTKYVIVETK